MVEFVPEADFETNAKQMAKNITSVKTIEITRAISSAKLNKLDIKQGQFIGLLDGELLVTGDSPEDTISQLFDIIDLSQFHLVTLYFGKETDKTSAEKIRNRILERYAHVDMGIVNGEQPYYQYIISVE
jgi:dihydroxyacetone kinase-like predicted kinase